MVIVLITGSLLIGGALLILFVVIFGDIKVHKKHSKS